MRIADAGVAIHPSAVVWIDEERACVARTTPEGFASMCWAERGSLSDDAFLAIVVFEIGPRERVSILGPIGRRLALERKYVEMRRRPDHLRDVDAATPVDEAELIDRLRRLAA